MPFDAHILGVDVGFSAKRRTTGIAWYADGQLGKLRTHSDPDRRLESLPSGAVFDCIALDAPLCPAAAGVRVVERVFSSGEFSRRCKPGFSHFGFGRRLREAGALAGETFSIRLRDRAPHCAIEAFPNAFMGVLLPVEVYALIPKLRRGKKFDWLYDRCVEHRLFDHLCNEIELDASQIIDTLNKEQDHEMRAALVCLLTAACKVQGEFEVVGDLEGGWFWLPPSTLWANWARRELSKTAFKLDAPRFE